MAQRLTLVAGLPPDLSRAARVPTAQHRCSKQRNLLCRGPWHGTPARVAPATLCRVASRAVIDLQPEDGLEARRASSSTASTSTSQAAVLPTDLPAAAARAADSAWLASESGRTEWGRAMDMSSGPEMQALLAEMGVRYDPGRLAEELRRRPLEINARAVRVSTQLGGFVARLLKDYALDALEVNMQRRARELRDILTGLGPAFVKIGQALSARPDLLPKVYLDTLSELQDRLPPFPTSVAHELIRQELGVDASAIFSAMSDVPVAAASLGQVYQARLRSTGQLVAVKVQRPGIGDSIAIDMLLLRRLMGVIDNNVKQVSTPLVPLVDEFAARLFGELDYMQEGRNAERFQELYGTMPRVATPGIIWAHTSRRVLTMDWVDGVKLTDKAAMAAAGLDIVDFVDVGIECTMRQLLEHGFFHADPHPGNLLATREGNLVYLDFGMMSSAPEYARYAIISHVVHLVNRDYEAMCRDYYALDFMDPSVDTSPIAPALAAFFDDVLDSSVSDLNFKAIVDGLGGVLFQYPFRVPAYYALILRSLTVLEGLALSADPRYKLLGRAYPYMARRLLTDPAPELRESLAEMVVEDGELRWGRLEDLLRQSALSAGFDNSQVWLLADWLVSPTGAPLRQPVVAELVRMLDCAAAETVRQRIVRRTGSVSLAERLVPWGPGEAETLARTDLLAGALGIRWEQFVPQVMVAGSGPWGLPRPDELQQVVVALRSWLAETVPRLQALMDEPGAREIQAELQAGLARRMFARSLKLVFGSSTSAAGAASKQQPAQLTQA